MTVSAPPIPLATWRELDWRMLLPVGDLGRVLYVGDSSELVLRALERASAEVRVVSLAAFRSTSDASEADVVIVASPRAIRAPDLRRLFCAVRPGAWLVLQVHARGSLTAGTWCRRAQRAGFTAVSAQWHAPSFRDCRYIVPLANRTSIRVVLGRYHDVRFGLAKSIGARALLAVGAIGLIARDATILVQRPAS
ncbi:MAG: hypothetical protein M3304_00500 [Actinomycetota bacterium]|nr:hypothetical protein [Actinomycetota bacterium]